MATTTRDVRGIIARFEAIEESEDEDDIEERDELKALLDELDGGGGDEEWRGSWYPITLIDDSFMEEYAKEFAEDIGAIGAIGRDMPWPTNCIDWKWAIDEFKMDYSTVEFDGRTYWYR